MKSLSLAAIMVMLIASPSYAGKKVIMYVVTDNHPTGGRGATNKRIFFQKGDPRFKVLPGGTGPGQCDGMFLGGFAFGHADPRTKDPGAVCGHGYVIRLCCGQEGPSPLSILPIEAPMPVEQGAAGAVDAAKLIRDMLPKIDKSDGDKMPVVIQIRDTIRSLDVLKGAKSIPKRQIRQ